MTNKLTREEKIKEIQESIKDMNDMIAGKGRHRKHTQEKIGRCTYCSCGMRAQTG